MATNKVRIEPEDLKRLEAARKKFGFRTFAETLSRILTPSKPGKKGGEK
jgi:anthranilate phosphoribosyltransferase